MVQETYQKAMAEVFVDEGGYSNDEGDSGGPTNWGITIADARMYWKHDATEEDVQHMPKSVAEDIYQKHYADPIRYNDLPAGVDYSIFDYGINSGVYKSVKDTQEIVGVPVDGKLGDKTLAAIKKQDPQKFINALYDKRLAFLTALSGWNRFGKGWGDRCKRGRALALSMASTMPSKAPEKPTGALITTTGAAGTLAVIHPTLWPYWVAGAGVIIAITVLVYWLKNRKANVV